MSSSDVMVGLHQKALTLLQEDADHIEKLIQVQMESLTNRRCPLYEEVLDTRMYGLSREIEFATRLGLITEESGRNVLSELERKLAQLYEALAKTRDE